MGYNGGFRNVNYYLGYSYNRYTRVEITQERRSGRPTYYTDGNAAVEQLVAGTYTSYQLTNSNPGSTDQSVSIGGNALENDSLEWSLQQGYSNREYYSGDMRATYNGARGSVNAGYSYDRSSERIDYGANGSIVAHADGITLGQDITDAAVLVKAPGLDNVKLTNDNTISTDYRGYAIVPYVTPYRRTDITLDSSTLGEDMELPDTTQSVVPTRGAIVRANYAGNIGRRALIQLEMHGDKPVPYGSTVTIKTVPILKPTLSVMKGWFISLACKIVVSYLFYGANGRINVAMQRINYFPRKEVSQHPKLFAASDKRISHMKKYFYSRLY